MIGAIIGDIVGSRYERRNHKSKDFELFDNNCRPTDDSVMSLAIAKAILDCDGDYSTLSDNAVSCMQEFGRKYKNAGYGGRFIDWIFSKNPEPYGSYGNGSAMRVGPCGFVAESIEEAKKLSESVTKVTHNHPEGLKGAEAIAVAIYLARSGKSKDEIKEYINKNYYDVSFTIDEKRPKYSFDVSCQGSVPIAFAAFFESDDFEDAIRTAISVGGDSDTIACMAGVLAEAYYGVPEDIIEDAIEFLDSKEVETLYYFEKNFSSQAINGEGESIGSVFEVIDESVDKIIPKNTRVEVDENSDDFILTWVNDDDIKPDFSSFDNKKSEYKDNKEKRSKKKSSKRKQLDELLQTAITNYNDIFTSMSDHGQTLFNIRQRSIDLLDYVEVLVNSIANHPKSFDDEIGEIKIKKKIFNDECEFAISELAAARKAALGIGSGIAGGTAVVSLAPSAAMWIATTFGHASTGTAISALSGAASTNAALAWLGGGAAALGGGGMAAGNALLAMAGPVGWGIAGVSILSSIVLLSNKKSKIDKEKKNKIKSIYRNTKAIKENDAKIREILEKTIDIRKGLNEQYIKCMRYFGNNYIELSEDDKLQLATMVNNAKALSELIKEDIQF